MIKSLSQKSGALWLGEHHNAERDHLLQVDMIRKLHAAKTKNSDSKSNSKDDKKQMLAIGLEQIQVQFQPVLDAYVAGSISTDEMRKNLEWNKRWTWPFEGYRGVVEAARNLKISLIALDVDSEDMSKVEAAGFPNLSSKKKAEVHS